jgi:5'-3' exonuclease
MAKRVLLIDGDQFLFKASIAVEKETKWDDQNHVLYSNSNEAWDVLVGMLDRIFERFETKEHALTFSAPPNFRFDVWPDYKGARDPRKPLCYATLREKVEGEYNCVAMEGLEADDVMGILATKPGKTQRIIISQDKDMRTIPTTVWNGKETYNISQAEADYFHMYQTLIGDTSDGYKGCPGIGPKKAEAMLQFSDLQEHRPLWPRVLEAYTKAGLTEADALTQARLARILRWSDWDAKERKPILWTP